MMWSNRLVEQLRKTTGLRNIAAETQDGGLRALMRIDRDKMGRLGISAQITRVSFNDGLGLRLDDIAVKVEINHFLNTLRARINRTGFNRIHGRHAGLPLVGRSSLVFDGHIVEFDTRGTSSQQQGQSKGCNRFFHGPRY